MKIKPKTIQIIFNIISIGVCIYLLIFPIYFMIETFLAKIGMLIFLIVFTHRLWKYYE